jgi:hypothetical protein
MRKTKPRSLITVVQSVGLLAVAAILGGVIGSRWSAGPVVDWRSFPSAHAVSANSDEAFAVCTAPIDGSTEGFFMLDFQTGDLSGGVLNQATGTFTGAYRCNVLTDLGFEPGAAKQPRFLLVSGMSNLRRSQAGPLGQSVLFVTDSSTGRTAAYGIPWNPQQSQKPFTSELVLLDVANPRGAAP